jgi:hypothetical protein
MSHAAGRIRGSVLIGLILGLCATLFLPVLSRAAEKKERPAFAEVDRQVRAHFLTIKGYQPGDLLTQSQVTPVVGVLANLGWKVPDQEQIMALVCEDKDPLVRHLGSPQGRKLMRSAGKDTAIYNRLHRLTMTEGGDAQLRDMMKLPNGIEVAKTLTNDPRGKDIAKRLSRSPKAPDFNKPTGRIYTEDELLARLRTSYNAEAKKPAHRK